MLFRSRLPALINGPDEMPNERNVVWLHRFPQEFHVRVFGRAVSFLIVAFDAGCHEVFPRIFSQSCLRENMVDRQRNISPAAILAPVSITAKNVLSRKDDLLVRNVHKDAEPHDARERHRHGNRMYAPILARFDEFGLTEEEEDNCFLGIADAHRLIVLIEDEHFAAQLTVRMWYVVRTEDLATSLRDQKILDRKSVV